MLVMAGAVPMVMGVEDSAVPREVPRAVWYASLGPLPINGVTFDSSMYTL